MAWDPETAEPLHRALVWQDRRTAARCDELKEEGHEPLFRERTGLVLDPYFSGTKIEWLLNDGGVDSGAAFGTIDSWLLQKLTGRHVTDYSNASRTLLFDIHKLEWDPELCEVLGVTPGTRCRAAPERARLRRDERVRRQRPGGGHRGDQQAALYGQACHSPGTSARTRTGRAASCWRTRGRARRGQEGLRRPSRGGSRTA